MIGLIIQIWILLGQQFYYYIKLLLGLSKFYFFLKRNNYNFFKFISFLFYFNFILFINFLNRWGLIVGSYAERFNFYLSVFYFNSFQFIVILILLSLIRGLIWEVFTVINSIITPEEYSNEKHLTIYETKSVHNTQINSASTMKSPNLKNQSNDLSIKIKNVVVTDEITKEKNVIESYNVDDTFNMKLPSNLNIYGVFSGKINRPKLKNDDILSEQNEKEENSSATSDKIISLLMENNKTKEVSLNSLTNTEKLENDKIKIKFNKKNNLKVDFSDSHQEIKESSNSNSIQKFNSSTVITNENRSNHIRFYRKKIKHIKYFISYQNKNKQNNGNFDENEDFFNNNNKNSINYLEEFLINNLEDNDQLNENESKKKVETKGVRYGKNPNFLFKKAILKDLNIEQIKV